MKRYLRGTNIVRLAGFFLAVIAWCAVGRSIFYLVYHGFIAESGEASWLPMLWHGLKLDSAVAGYLTVVPVLILIGYAWCRGGKSRRVMDIVWASYSLLAALILSLAFLANIVLYGYWGFPLDSTPLFYLMTSPADAAASAEWWQMLLAAVALIVCTVAVQASFKAMRPRNGATRPLLAKVLDSFLLLLFGGLLFIPIRGGFGVSTNNVGGVYFSENIRLNHAAVNPVFSFLESVTHDEDFANMYRFMDDAEAQQLFDSMTYTALRPDSITSYRVSNEAGTKVVVVILESFSSYIMEEEGHVRGVVPTIDSLSKNSIYFNKIYANSFRTDRGIVSVLSGYPAQPNMSLMKYPHKTNGLYSIAASLRKAGYHTQYVYGGDANFTNMRSYLMATGFDNIICDADFPASQLTGKWGANDGCLFDKAIETADKQWTPDSRNLMVIQTSSSHEPFDAPIHVLDDKILNAFHYADRELGRFLGVMSKRDDWRKTVVVIVPDHQGCWPDPEDNYKLRRYHVPLIITGGAVREQETISTYGSQQDIAATLLAMLRIDHSEFTFSKDLFDTSAPHFAFFTHPDAVGMADEDNQVMTDNVSKKSLFDFGPVKGKNRKASQAYLQKLFDDIAKR